jgi:phosphoribosylformylglycinamidine cyclo-ligase
MQEKGKVDADEMYRVFNMGIGYVIFVRKKDVENTMAILKEQRAAPRIIGKVEKGKKSVVLV